jgi:glycosyltransferase involved in cell wall biosynthesis
MKLILSHPTANNFTRAIAYKLVRENLLHEFYTSIASFPGGILDKLQKINSLSEIQRRNFEIILKPYAHTFPGFEIARMLAMKMRLSKLTRHEYGLLSVDALYRYMDRKVASGLKESLKFGVTSVYAYEDGALATFTQAKTLGMKCIYDLPIAYWETSRELLEREAIRLPAWTQTLGGGVSDSKEKLERKTRELELADLIVVPSQFVKNSLPGWAKNKEIVISPFGTPVDTNKQPEIRYSSGSDRPLRILFAGSMGQRKGLADLFSAVKSLDKSKVELVVMGGLQAPMEFYIDKLPNFIYEPGRPNREVLKLMASCDIFCLPSIVEGRALVMQEAMSQGLPLIITPNTGGEDLIIEGETGFLIPIRSPEIIAEKINWFLENREKIPNMGNMAKLQAGKLTWDSYTTKIINSIKSLEGLVN